MSKIPVLDVEKKVLTGEENGQVQNKLKKTYSYEEAFEASKVYFKGDELAANVWINKYALKDSAGNIYEKTPNDLHNRLASEIARVEKKYDNPLTEKEIFNLLKDFKYIIPQIIPLINYYHENGDTTFILNSTKNLYQWYFK